MFQKIRNAGVKLAAVPALALIGVSSAYAELPTEVSTAVTEYKTDALAAIGMVLAAGVAIWGLRKLGTKLGWF